MTSVDYAPRCTTGASSRDVATRMRSERARNGVDGGYKRAQIADVEHGEMNVEPWGSGRRFHVGG